MNIDDIIENARLKGRVVALEAEVQTLQAEVRCLEAVIRSHERVDCLTVANLKAEVERLRASSFVTAVSVEQYVRVVKAGDALAGMVGYHVPYEDQIELEKSWNAAKEGKPSV